MQVADQRARLGTHTWAQNLDGFLRLFEPFLLTFPHIHCPYDIVQIERLQTENRSLKAETSKLCGQLEALARRCRRYRARRAKMARFQSENANMWE